MGGWADRCRGWLEWAEVGVSRAVRVFSKKLLRRRGVLFAGFGARWGRLGATALRGDASTGRPSPPDLFASGAGSNPFPQGEGARGGPFCGGAARGVGRGWQEGEGAQRERGQAWHEWGQGERGEAGGHRRRAEQDGEQAQDGWDQAQEAFERQARAGAGSKPRRTRMVARRRCRRVAM